MIGALTEPELPLPQHRTILLKKGLCKSAEDEPEASDENGEGQLVMQRFPLSNTDTDDWVDERFYNSSQKIRPFVDEGAEVPEPFGILARRSINFHPLAPPSTVVLPMVFALKSRDLANVRLNLAPLRWRSIPPRLCYPTFR